MAFVLLREKARALRQNGESIAKIGVILHASKSTVSYWCRDIALSAKQVRRLAFRQQEAGALGRLRAAEKKRDIRMEAVRGESNRGSRDAGILSQGDLFILGVGLYWGEGYKSGNEECGLTNSNPDIIRAFIVWLKEIHSVRSPDLILRVSINHSHKQRVRAVEKYWSNMTKIPLSQFTKTSLIKTKSQKIYTDQDDHFGTIRVKVRRATALRRRILGSIDEIARQVREI